VAESVRTGEAVWLPGVAPAPGQALAPTGARA
jgi:hypothetical protein